MLLVTDVILGYRNSGRSGCNGHGVLRGTSGFSGKGPGHMFGFSCLHGAGAGAGPHMETPTGAGVCT